MFSESKLSLLSSGKYICFFAVALLYVFICLADFGNDSQTVERKNSVRTENSKLGKSLNESVTVYGYQSERQKFFVQSAQCKIPYVNIFSRELLAVYVPMEYEPCTNDSDLVTPIFDVNTKHYRLHINEDVAAKLLKSDTEEYNCYYQEIVLDPGQDRGAEPLPRKYFSQDYVVPLHVEGLMVECYSVLNTTHSLQRDAYFLVQHKAQLKKKPSASKMSGPRQPSVIMFGIDSMSRINFRRMMPKVYDYMGRNGWYELQGYNKVADNTFPNLLAILTGYTPETAKQICDTDESGCFDRFPFIWKFFKNLNYLTALAEDNSGLNTFNYCKPGFQHQPVDYYLRPFVYSIEDYMNVVRYKVGGARQCIGRRHTSSYIYDFCRNFMQRFVNEQPIFGLFFSTSFSHNDYAIPGTMQDKILQYMLDFEADGAFESTIMIFFADHGSRYGTLVQLPEGFLEERLPMMFIWLPAWFRRQYPDYARALELNRNRLSSNYDLHMTLKHIIELAATARLQLPPAADCPKCQSLFYPLPVNRTCADAGIDDHWCTCYPYETVTPFDYARRMPQLIIDRINVYIAEKQLSTLCSNLTLRYIAMIERRLHMNDQGIHDISNGDVYTYRVQFKANPNGPDFQATVEFNNRTADLQVDVESISRLSAYHDDSLCIDDKIAKKYCICYDSIKKDAK